MKKTILLTGFISLVSWNSASAQGSWTYDFKKADTNSTPWISNNNAVVWQGKMIERFGILHAGDPYMVSGLRRINQGVNASIDMVDTSSSYSLSSTTAPTVMTMGWSARPHRGLVDDGFDAGNEIFQIGLVDSTASLMGVDTNRAFYLAGIEVAAAQSTGVTNVRLSMMDNLNGVLGSFNAGTTYAFTAEDYYIFKMTMTPGSLGRYDVSLEMDILEAVPGGYSTMGDYTPGAHVDFGTISVKSEDMANLYVSNANAMLNPALGLKFVDATKVSISGASFDTVPEPSSAFLLSLSSLLLFRRKR